MFCRIIIIWYECLLIVNHVTGDYGVGGEQRVLDVQPSVTWDREGGYIMFCLCMGEFAIEMLSRD